MKNVLQMFVVASLICSDTFRELPFSLKAMKERRKRMNRLRKKLFMCNSIGSYRCTTTLHFGKVRNLGRDMSTLALPQMWITADH